MAPAPQRISRPSQIGAIAEAQRNQPNGFVGIDDNGIAAGTLVHRVDTAAAIDLIVLEAGEIAFTSDTKELRCGDGTTPGGLLVTSGWRHHAYVLPSTPDTNYVNLISVPLGVGIWEYKAFVHTASGAHDFIANLIISPYTGNAPIVGAANFPTYGPVGWASKRYMGSFNGTPDEQHTKYAWNLVELQDWGDTLNETQELGHGPDEQYRGVFYEGLFSISTDADSDFILRCKTPDGAASPAGIVGGLSLRRVA